MRKLTYFDRFDQEGWPDPRELKPYFFAPPGQEWFNHYGNDTAGLTMEGLYGTENEDHIAERPRGPRLLHLRNTGSWRVAYLS
jgi:hypothetical protein